VNKISNNPAGTLTHFFGQCVQVFRELYGADITVTTHNIKKPRLFYNSEAGKMVRYNAPPQHLQVLSNTRGYCAFCINESPKITCDTCEVHLFTRVKDGNTSCFNSFHASI
jgi:hypothetical protein